MKAALILVTLSLCIAANGVHAQQAKPDEAGTLTYGGQSGAGEERESFTLTVGPVHGGRSRISVAIQHRGCLGDATGLATVRGDVLDLTKTDDGFDCRLTIHRSATGATITERDCMAEHGMSCNFDTGGRPLRLVK